MLISKYSRYIESLSDYQNERRNQYPPHPHRRKGNRNLPTKIPQNVPLTVACTPPEILGYIFQLAVEPQILPGGHINLAGVKKGSYNFLLVCHHWYEVARCTPELWSFWGADLESWRRHCLCHETYPIDLVLSDYSGRRISDEILNSAIKGRAKGDLVRKVHLGSMDKGLLTSIISSLTPRDEGTQHSSIESIVLVCVDVSDFFARHRFLKLRNLVLFESLGFDFDHMKSHITTLINLSLHTIKVISARIPTTAQILSLLSSNPNL